MGVTSTLSFVQAVRNPNAEGERRYWDYALDQERLRTRFHAPGVFADTISPFGWAEAQAASEAVDALLLRRRPELKSGRYALWICPECGDLGCGAITARIERAGSVYVWSDFALENNYDETMTAPLSVGPTIQFDAAQYELAFRTVLERI